MLYKKSTCNYLKISYNLIYSTQTIQVKRIFSRGFSYGNLLTVIEISNSHK